MAGSGLSSDAQHRYVLILLSAIAFAAICVSLFATGRTANGLALVSYQGAKIGVLSVAHCSSGPGEPCWGNGHEAAYFHNFLLGSHIAALAITGLAGYHQLITRRALRRNVVARCFSLLAVVAAFTMTSCILLLAAVTDLGLEVGTAFPFAATVAQAVIFGTLMALWATSPAASAETRHGTIRLTEAEEARRYQHGWWQNQQAAPVVPASEKRKQSSIDGKKCAVMSKSSQTLAYGHNSQRLEIGQVVSREKHRWSSFTHAFTTRKASASHAISPKAVYEQPTRKDPPPKPTFLSPPDAQPRPFVEPTLCIEEDDLWERGTITTSVMATAPEAYSPQSGPAPSQWPERALVKAKQDFRGTKCRSSYGDEPEMIFWKGKNKGASLSDTEATHLALGRHRTEPAATAPTSISRKGTSAGTLNDEPIHSERLRSHLSASRRERINETHSMKSATPTGYDTHHRESEQACESALQGLQLRPQPQGINLGQFDDRLKQDRRLAGALKGLGRRFRGVAQRFGSG